MTTVLVVLLATLVPVGAVCFGAYGTRWHKARPTLARAGIWNRVQEADRSVQAAYRDARRSMNVAAGQSWRNLAD